MNRLKIISVICGAIFLSGCAHHYSGHHAFTAVTPGYVSVSAPVVSVYGSYRVYDPVIYYPNRRYAPHYHQKRSYYSRHHNRHQHRPRSNHSDRRRWRDRRRH